MAAARPEAAYVAMATLIAGVALAAAVLLPADAAAPHPPIDTSMLERWTPEDLSSLHSDSLAQLASGWTLADQPEAAAPLFQEIEDRGPLAYALPFADDMFGDGTINPPDTQYTITIALVGEALRFGGRDFTSALEALDTVPFVDGCRAYSNSEWDARMGCVHNVNAIAASFLSRVGGDYEKALLHEQTTMLSGGVWWYWQQAPEPRLNDVAHHAWTAYELLNSPDERLRDLGATAAAWLHEHFEMRSDGWALPEVIAALVAAGYPDGCLFAPLLPAWAEREPSIDRYGLALRRQALATFVYTLSQANCDDPAIAASVPGLARTH